MLTVVLLYDNAKAYLKIAFCRIVHRNLQEAVNCGGRLIPDKSRHTFIFQKFLKLLVRRHTRKNEFSIYAIMTNGGNSIEQRL